ncbi:hypothetical protein B0J13DRAFT_533988 [Dactylonectria estremocensis]|uniref:Uncharacterized protein n=1 Tax=Dactylonectria estremocensis TaxID=1079267 RepID=A0A9P9D5K3_9HYPO|nr:hypothetical protein B0J13DRAFT_534069 [Dactylonectria estremocensis]KAH7113003.1 hypothetical protein B0J13DRAFT_533988 [Dactylonectria estremocensis]
MTGKSITRSIFWNFNETPLQIGWVDGSLKLFSTQIKGKTHTVTFQPGNKDSLSAVNAINTSKLAITSFLILTAKVLLEEYIIADINDRVVLTHTSSGFNNTQRARQWLQHFNYHSFAYSNNFKDFSLKTWFSYSPDLIRENWNQKSSHKKIIKLQKEQIRLEARRTHTRRRIQVNDGAYTVDQLRQKVNTRSHEERAAAARKEGQFQAGLFRSLHEKEAAHGSNKATSQAHPRGRAAAIAKAARQVEEEAQMQDLRDRQRLSYDANAIEKLSQQWADANGLQRSFLYTTQPLSNLLAIPEVVT